MNIRLVVLVLTLVVSANFARAVDTAPPVPEFPEVPEGSSSPEFSGITDDELMFETERFVPQIREGIESFYAEKQRNLKKSLARVSREVIRARYQLQLDRLPREKQAELDVLAKDPQGYIETYNMETARSRLEMGTAELLASFERAAAFAIAQKSEQKTAEPTVSNPESGTGKPLETKGLTDTPATASKRTSFFEGFKRSRAAQTLVGVGLGVGAFLVYKYYDSKDAPSLTDDEKVELQHLVDAHQN